MCQRRQLPGQVRLRSTAHSEPSQFRDSCVPAASDWPWLHLPLALGSHRRRWPVTVLVINMMETCAFWTRQTLTPDPQPDHPTPDGGAEDRTANIQDG
uniref:Uncharacterized protein n=1 Tax=Knipowitschia caucasica TaxID=637954 RepID=A0AAV2KGN6_KNICA